MEIIEAGILLKNLIERLHRNKNGFALEGGLTSSEYRALRLAEEALCSKASVILAPQAAKHSAKILPGDKEATAESQVIVDFGLGRVEENNEFVGDSDSELIELNTSVLQLPSADPSKKLCIDFGTAMSKVALITDDGDFEEIDILELGVPGDQEQISSTMLVSSVYIDLAETLRFGQDAREQIMLDNEVVDPPRSLFANIKRSLSEDTLSGVVTSDYNPTNIELKHRDIVLAYLMFLTWTMRKSLESLGEEINIDRRYAMPCLDEVHSLEVARDLKAMLGEAQILADTFYDELENGVSVSDFKSAANQLSQMNLDYPFITDNLTEPLGVANTLLDKDQSTDSLVMIIDIGAGTTDFSMYRVLKSPNQEKNIASEIKNTTEGIKKAGAFLDGILIKIILEKAGVTSHSHEYQSVLSRLSLDIQHYKIMLFDQEYVVIPVGSQSVEISKNEFLDHEDVRGFAKALKSKQLELLEKVADEFIKPTPNNIVVVVITGGGSSLPITEELANTSVQVGDKTVRLERVNKVPTWIMDNYEELELEYPRLAVAIGGARQELIKAGSRISVGAGSAVAPNLAGYYSD